jgi:ATP/maltotriose-dependent transcriptional regulator MalT
MLWRTGLLERGVELLTLVHHHPASDWATKAKAQEALDHYTAKLPPEQFAAAGQRGRQSDLGQVVAGLQVELELSQEHEAAENIQLISRQNGHSAQPLVEPLTPRELEVLQLIANGLTNQQMADQLIVSVGTAKWYTSQIYSKLNVSSRTQAVARARELELLF